MTNSAQKNHAFMYHDRRYSRNVHYDRRNNDVDSHAMIASSSSIMHDRNLARKNVIHHMPRRNVVHAPKKVSNKHSTIYHACNASFAICRKDKKVVARKLGAKCKGDKTCIWSLRLLLLTL